MRDHLVNDLMHFLCRRATPSGSEPEHIELGVGNGDPCIRLSRSNLPSAVRTLLYAYWPTHGCSAGPYRLHAVEEILDYADDYPSLLAHHLLTVGGSTSGDFLVVEFSDHDLGPVWFISHDDFLGHSEETGIRKRARVSRSLEEMLLRAAEGRYLPDDFYVAEELAQLKDELDGDGVQ